MEMENDDDSESNKDEIQIIGAFMPEVNNFRISSFNFVLFFSYVMLFE